MPLKRIVLFRIIFLTAIQSGVVFCSTISLKPYQNFNTKTRWLCKVSRDLLKVDRSTFLLRGYRDRVFWLSKLQIPNYFQWYSYTLTILNILISFLKVFLQGMIIVENLTFIYYSVFDVVLFIISAIYSCILNIVNFLKWLVKVLLQKMIILFHLLFDLPRGALYNQIWDFWCV